MADETIRGERDPGRLLLAKIRAGQVQRADVLRDAAYGGDEVAQAALGVSRPVAILLLNLGPWAEKPHRVPTDVARQALAEYFRAHGYTADRWGKFVSSDGTRRINFAPRNVQTFGKKAGGKEWHKRSSRTFTQAVQDILLNTGAVEGLQEKVEKKKEVQKKAGERKRETDLVNRLAVVMTSLHATAEEREQTLLDEFLPEAVDNKLAAELSRFTSSSTENLTIDGINANLSAETPPLLVWRKSTPAFRMVRCEKMPASFSWIEKKGSHNVRVEVVRDYKSYPAARVRVGNIPLDPFTMSVIGDEFMSGDKRHGFSATMSAQGQTAVGKISFMLVDGAGDELGLSSLLTLLKLFGSYGIEAATVTSAGASDVAFIKWAVERDAVSATRSGGTLYLRARAQEDPNQLKLFNRRAAESLLEDR